MEATTEEKMEQVHEYGDIEDEVLMNQSIVFKEPIPIVEKRWLRNNIRLTSIVNGQTCMEEVLTSSHAFFWIARKLYCPYFVHWLMTSDEVQV